MGFIDYVNSLPKKKVQLFPDLERGKRSWGDHVSKWFNAKTKSNFRAKAGVLEEGKDYHSFRHTVISYLGNKYDVPDDKVKLIVGHDREKTMGTTAIYSHATVEDLAKHLNHLDYGLDIQGLKASWSKISPRILRKLK